MTASCAICGRRLRYVARRFAWRHERPVIDGHAPMPMAFWAELAAVSLPGTLTALAVMAWVAAVVLTGGAPAR